MTQEAMSRNEWKVYVHIVPKDISNNDENKYYVGITSQDAVNNRWRNGHGYKKNAHFWRAIQKYGWENLQHDIVAENLTFKEASEFEKVLIKELKSNDYHYGYNVSPGGESGAAGLHSSEKQKEVTSKRMKEAWKDPEYRERMTKMSQEIHTPEWRKDHSRKLKALWADEEYRKNHSGVNHHSYGKKTEPKYGADNPNAKQIICLNTLKIYGSIKDAHLDTGCSICTIGKCCNHKSSACPQTDSQGRRYTWRTYEDYLKMSEDNVYQAIMNGNTIKSPFRKPVINLEDLRVFEHSTDAAKFYNIKSYTNISSACRDHVRSGGYYWQYLDDYLKENNTDLEKAKSLLIFMY